MQTDDVFHLSVVSLLGLCEAPHMKCVFLLFDRHQQVWKICQAGGILWNATQTHFYSHFRKWEASFPLKQNCQGTDGELGAFQRILLMTVLMNWLQWTWCLYWLIQLRSNASGTGLFWIDASEGGLVVYWLHVLCIFSPISITGSKRWISNTAMSPGDAVLFLQSPIQPMQEST